MIPRVRWLSVAVGAVLAVSSPSLAEEAGHLPGKGGIGGQIGGSSFRFDRALGKSWFGDYSHGALTRFSFNGHFRYVVNSWLRWQVSPGFTWAAYGDLPAPMRDPRFPDDTDKADYLTLLLPVSAQLQVVAQRGDWLYYLGTGPGLYRVWVQNQRKVIKDPVTFRLHRGLYWGGSAQLGVERFLKRLPSTSIELALAGHLALAQRDEQFPSGINTNLLAVEARLGVSYYFDIRGEGNGPPAAGVTPAP